MGYTTEFSGEFKLDKPLKREHSEYLLAFANTRRMRRNPVKADLLQDPVRLAAGLPIGSEACYFVGGKGFAGQDKDDSIAEYNIPPFNQPELWCHWVPNDSGTSILWDGGEKFGSYVDWIRYQIKHFFGPWNYKLNGKVFWYGEDPLDTGIIIVKDNMVSTKTGRIVYE